MNHGPIPMIGDVALLDCVLLAAISVSSDFEILRLSNPSSNNWDHYYVNEKASRH
jgi:hypothetical protein